MTTFDEREHAFEAKFAHDAELRFRAEARRTHLLGRWAAKKLGLTGDEAEAYAKALIRADFATAGHEDLLGKLAADLDGRADEAEIRAMMAETLVQARAQILEETE
ncbi:MAG: DUF1476 domain-containing protein [Tranquillimonas sp.]